MDKLERIEELVDLGEQVVDRMLAHAESDFEERMAAALRCEWGDDAPLLSLKECHVLSGISEDGQENASALAARMGLTRGGMSKILSRLQAKGYLSIGAKEGNRKEQALGLTPHGLRAVELHGELHRAAQEKWKAVLARHSETELRAVELVLKDIIAAQ